LGNDGAYEACARDEGPLTYHPKFRIWSSDLFYKNHIIHHLRSQLKLLLLHLDSEEQEGRRALLDNHTILGNSVVKTFPFGHTNFSLASLTDLVDIKKFIGVEQVELALAMLHASDRRSRDWAVLALSGEGLKRTHLSKPAGTSYAAVLREDNGIFRAIFSEWEVAKQRQKLYTYWDLPESIQTTRAQVASVRLSSAATAKLTLLSQLFSIASGFPMTSDDVHVITVRQSSMHKQLAYPPF
jgi:hypothetical protein